MTSQPPSAEFVDPCDRVQVAAVFAAVLKAWGIEGVGDLLGRLPGVRLAAGEPRRRFRAATPPTVTIGSENQLVLAEPPEHLHVVGGVVLSRRALPPGELPLLLADLVTRLTREQASYDDSAAALTAAREVLDAG